MKTYGRKRKGLLSPFAKFQDGSQQSPGRSAQSSYLRLSSPETDDVSKLESDMNIDAEDSVEAMANALLEDTSQLSLNRTPLSGDRTSHLEPSEMIMFDARNKPLPPLPDRNLQDDLIGARRQTKRSAAPSAKKEKSTTKAKPVTKARNPVKVPKTALKGKNLKPDKKELAMEPEDSLQHHATEKEHALTSQDVPRDVTTVAGAEELSRKINSLMAAAEEKASKAKSEQVRAAEKGSDGKRPRLQRSREVLAKVKGAITDRLTSSAKKPNHKLQHNHPPSPRAKSIEDFDQLSYHHSNNSNVSPKIEPKGKSIGLRLDAEGKNLGNTKIRSLTGVSIPRKPLPSQGSGPSLNESHSSAEDPFSDYHRMINGADRKGLLSYSSGSDLDRPSATRLGYMTTTQLPNPRRYNPDRTTEASRGLDSSKASPAMSEFVQHPDSYAFSSSPDCHSTPQIHIDSYEDDLEMVQHSGSEDEGDIQLESMKRSNSKRQGAEKVIGNDLLAPPSKKAKKAAVISSKRPATLAKGDDRPDSRILADKDGNIKIRGQAQSTISGTGKISSLNDLAGKSNGHPAKGSAMSKPARKSPAHARTFLDDNSDDMEIDELQLDLSEYRIGHTRR